MMRIAFFSVLMATTAVFASTGADISGQHWANAYHSGTGEVLHDGDFIEFTLDFDSACVDDRAASWNYVTNNVANFIAWLNAEKANYELDGIDYQVDPISWWRQDSNYYNDNGCGGKYYASQTVKITLHRLERESALCGDFVQEFYNRLQGALWPLNQADEADASSRVSATIAWTEKGIYEETADQLRIAAKAKALDKASKDFLSFLSPDYRGNWYIESVDFRESSANVYRWPLETSLPAPSIPGSLPTPSILKLSPLKVVVTGNFHFVYDVSSMH